MVRVCGRSRPGLGSSARRWAERVLSSFATLSTQSNYHFDDVTHSLEPKWIQLGRRQVWVLLSSSSSSGREVGGAATAAGDQGHAIRADSDYPRQSGVVSGKSTVPAQGMPTC